MQDSFLTWLFAGGLLSIAGFTIATYLHVNQVKEDLDRKRTRVYERLDEVKQNADAKFVNKDICKILHEQMSRDVSEIKTDIKMLLRMKQNEGDAIA